jgi:phenylalanine ammonia-lyase
MLVRANCLLRGHSAVRIDVIETLIKLLNLDFIPVVPLRGSISASGDLSPLSYIAGALTGSPDILIDCLLQNGSREIMTADKALGLAGLKPIVMGPKEGLGMLNGTSVSCAVACLALHETQYLALAAQVLTGMCTEAMGGCADNYHPFISRIRPHPGQIETAANIYRQISGSRLVSGKTGAAGELYQDRYALRTASQWIGPYLEDLSLSIDQLTIELNSTTDNPLVDPISRTVHNGGNFQAVAVTSAVEKARLALQMIGKLLFAQCTELINPMMNNILPPNLCFDDPSTSFTFKGVDINMAAYMGELAFLANPVSSHVQSAEMHNQALNSLALVSARFTLDAVEVVSLMTAAYLYAACQALDLHALFKESSKLILSAARSAFDAHFPLESAFANNPSAAETCWTTLAAAIHAGLIEYKIKNRLDRARLTAEATVLPLTKALLAINPTNTAIFANLTTWLPTLTAIIADSLLTARQQFASPSPGGPTTLRYLSPGSARMYRFIRETLNVPLHRGLIEDPNFPDAELQGITLEDPEKERKTTGSRIGVIYKAIREGSRKGGFGEVVVSCLS